MQFRAVVPGRPQFVDSLEISTTVTPAGQEIPIAITPAGREDFYTRHLGSVFGPGSSDFRKIACRCVAPLVHGIEGLFFFKPQRALKERSRFEARFQRCDLPE
jgi:hypothetical protein